MLHGATGNGDSLRNNSEIALNEKGDQKGFIIVYPEGTGDTDTRSYYWNAAHCCGSAWIEGVDDVGFIKNLIEVLTKDLNLDPGRIFLMGFSNGGMMAYRIGSEIPELITAIAPVAGSIGGRFSPDSEKIMIPIPTEPLPVIIFHGLLDQEVPYYGGNIVAANGRIDLPVSKAVTFWVKYNFCTPEPVTLSGSYGEYTKDVYSPSEENGAPVILYTFRDLAHSWPAEVDGRSTTDIIFEFFDNFNMK